MLASEDWRWCGREDSNFHGVTPTAPSTLRVYHSATTASCTCLGSARFYENESIETLPRIKPWAAVRDMFAPVESLATPRGDALEASL
jgi:hypothetical protein